MGKKQTDCRKQRLNHLGQQMIWQLQETRALQVELSLHQVECILLWLQVTILGGLLTKEVYAYSDRISCMYVYI